MICSGREKITSPLTFPEEEDPERWFALRGEAASEDSGGEGVGPLPER